MKVNWKETFNPHDLFGSLTTALDEAHHCGYPYLYWDGDIIDVQLEIVVGREDKENTVYINGVEHANTGGEK